MSTSRRTRWDALIVGALAASLVAAVGATLTDLGPWYHSLREPAWKPPDWAFGPIWTAILALTVVSGVRAYSRDPAIERRQWIVGLFALNGCLNILWSLLFFRLHRPDWALLEVGPYWLSIAAAAAAVYPLSRLSGALLLPYLVWVGIASVLNYDIVQLNRPFS